MANSLVQFRASDSIKNSASDICDRLGIDLQTYLRLCLFKLVQEKGIPFSMKLEESDEYDPISVLQKEAKANRTSEMTLDEINEEIEAARKEMWEKKSSK